MRSRYRLVLAASLMIFAAMTATAADWRFHSSSGPNGNTIFLSESSSTTKGCSGKKEASEQMFALNAWTFIRYLCYEVDKAGMVKLTDPVKVIFFNTFTIHSSKFTSIPTEKERLEKEQRQDMAAMARQTNEWIRQSNEDKRQQQQQQQRRPIICNHMGDMTFCD